MISVLILSFLFIPAGGLFCQNLIPNGDFEEIVCPTNDYNSIDTTDTWYSITSADAYWIHEADCPVDEAIANAAWYLNPQIEPYSGDGFISLEGVTTASGFHIEEGVGIQLLKPLEAGKAYYFEMAALNQGAILGDGHPGVNCGDINTRLIEVHFAEEPLKFERTVNNFGVITGIHNNSTFHIQHPMGSGGPEFIDRWLPHWECFVATGNQTHIGVTGNVRQITSPCAEEEKQGVLWHFGHSIDALQLYELPAEIDTIAFICEDGGWVDIHDFVSDPYFDKATYIWDDGCMETRRALQNEGIRTIEMILPCVSIPITLDIRIGNGCEEVTYSDTFPKELVMDIAICTDEPLQPTSLRAALPENMKMNASFRWPDGGTNPTRTLEQAGTYQVEVSTDCYSFPLIIHAEERFCQINIYVPDIFSPNSDGRNDGFCPFIHSPYNIINYHFKIFDRWGSLVFQTNGPMDKWDGKINGQPAGQGAYVWLLEFQLDGVVDSKRIEKGEVVLIR